MANFTRLAIDKTPHIHACEVKDYRVQKIQFKPVFVSTKQSKKDDEDEIVNCIDNYYGCDV